MSSRVQSITNVGREEVKQSFFMIKVGMGVMIAFLLIAIISLVFSPIGKRYFANQTAQPAVATTAVTIVGDAETLTQRQFIRLVETAVGQPVQYRTAGKMMIWLVGLFNKPVREVLEMMYEFEEPFVVDHSRFVAAFGNGVTPHEAAIAETVVWYRDNK